MSKHFPYREAPEVLQTYPSAAYNALFLDLPLPWRERIRGEGDAFLNSQEIKGMKYTN
ncbi:MAG TPA: hypothetical protein VLA94_03750 [Syntrophales bacterium]|nr:hypothetical protein [Syntrophales bacterium]